MADLPISFSAPMVRALLDGNKTQTRRALSPQPRGHVWRYGWEHDKGATWSDDAGHHRLRIWASDRLYVREHWRTTDVLDDIAPRDLRSSENETVDYTPVCYEADGATRDFNPLHDPGFGRFRQGMHMPRWASRLTLIVTDVRVERLQSISEADSIAEGCIPDNESLNPNHIGPATSIYAALWNMINGPGAWEANPWVVAYTFTVHRSNIDQIGGAA